MGTAIECRVHEGSATMTRKQAIRKAIQLISYNEENAEVIEKLQDIMEDLPLNHWSDKSIRDSIDEFIFTYKRVPTGSDFSRRSDLPSHPVIKQKYKVTLADWLAENYPTHKPTREERKEKYMKNFLADYYRIKPTREVDFNPNRSENTVCWQTIASCYDVKSWYALLEVLKLPIYKREHKRSPKKRPVITVKIHSDYDFNV